jgi:membrane protein insertase Oxa1/YidC/SpoIIIJ
MAIKSLDVIHATTGLPWWATIIATTVAVRTVFFPITVISVGDLLLGLLVVQCFDTN